MIKIKFNFCDLCGKVLTTAENLYQITDCRDKYNQYHYKYWNICDECHEELVEKREAVIAAIKAENTSDTESTS